MGDADESNRRAGPRDGERRRERLGRSDAFDGGVDAHSIRQLQDCLGRRIATLGDDVCGAKGSGQRLAGRVPAEGDDPGGAKSPGTNDGAQANGTVPDDGDNAARPDASTHGRVVAGGHDIGEGQQRTQCFV